MPKKITSEQKTPDDAPSSAAVALGRFPAGEDPIKRGQILDGAKRVFMKMGYDAASMNDVTREAGVSKGTIYVYFQSKEELFAALIDRAKGQFTDTVRETLAQSVSAEDGLRRFGQAFANRIFNSEMIASMRILLGVIDRMPLLCQRYLADSPSNARGVLKSFLDRHVADGTLEIADTSLAAKQFIELTGGIFLKGRLFNEIPEEITPEEIHRVIESGLKVFLAAYACKAEAGSHPG
ncbi:TetR/AcrR family transcriptional regulator [Rhizobium glycinendophyticum]|uniref:TetR/AcrR family transcriptional regulator n=1 Tax=Rhizobium glycinendophyticum TaxID=2589807 RepID=A0A504UM89_9HYPH|nr:TetR/AcrR family transcriptional regulator [Rhizobium glycinendophyticum]TPP06562.1 TetR/AcrR family transcriptional regulator [Rhizobium glycinendophyticum]